jgi:hypothetical protein
MLHLAAPDVALDCTLHCRAENRLGKARRAVVVRVLHPPDIVSVSGTQLVSQGDSVGRESSM